MASKRETILEYLRVTLFPQLTQANGYTNTLKKIERGERNPNSLSGRTDFPALFIAEAREVRQNETTNAFQSRMSVGVIAYVKTSKPSPSADRTGLMLDIDRMIADITKLVYTNETQGGLVHVTEIIDVDCAHDDKGELGGISMVINFEYTTEGTTP